MGLQFVSTKDVNFTKLVNFSDAVFTGLAPDGGLYCPTPQSMAEIQATCTKLLASLEEDISFVDLASRLTATLFEGEFDEVTAKQIVHTAFADKYHFEPIVEKLSDDISLLELFHGPSCAFKDFGAQYLAAVMEKRLVNNQKKITILTATSGDTGSAVAQAFFQKKNINVVILYPSKRVSLIQEKQLTSLGENIFALEVDGSFDDCQALVKQAFLDTDVKTQYNLTSANSINIGRLIPQSFYYMYVANKYRNDPFLFCTPSGNFGNLSAGLLAWQLGMQVQHFIAATNQNKVIPDYLKTKIYKPQVSVTTLANAMDVGAPSNFERMQYMFEHIIRTTSLEQVLYGAWASDKNILATMSEVQKKYNTYVCPHTAAGIYCAREVLPQTPYKKAMVLATAHAGKFYEVVQQACGNSISFEDLAPQRLRQFLHKEKQSHFMTADFVRLVEILQTLNLS